MEILKAKIAGRDYVKPKSSGTNPTRRAIIERCDEICEAIQTKIQFFPHDEITLQLAKQAVQTCTPISSAEIGHPFVDSYMLTLTRGQGHPDGNRQMTMDELLYIVLKEMRSHLLEKKQLRISGQDVITGPIEIQTRMM